MKIDNLMYNIKKILKKIKLLKNNDPNWNDIISKHKKTYNELKEKASKGQKILICTSTGGHLLSSHFEALLALTLTRYGANVEIMLCDKVLTACQMSTTQFISEKNLISKGQSKICNSCLDSGRGAFEDLGLKINYYSDFINKDTSKKISSKIKNLTIKEMQEYKEDNISIGEHAYAGTLRYYAVGELNNERHGETILRKYLYSAILTKNIFENYLAQNKIDKIILNHAIYVPQGIICNISKENNIKIIVYTNAYRKNSFIFSYDDTYHKTMIEEDVSDWENLVLDQKKEKIIIDYLLSRKYGTNDMFYYFKNPSFDIKKKLVDNGVDIKKPILGILTNVIWDAQIIYKNNIYNNMIDWLIDTIRYLSNRDDIEVVVRAHPGEIYGDRLSKQTVKETILNKLEKLPDNLKIIDSSSDISTYSFAEYCNTLVIYATKMGMEFSPFGNKVICAGESYIKNKKITYDPKSIHEYYELLNNFTNLKKPSEENINRAKKYAYHYFFRRTIQIDSLDSKVKSWPPFKISLNSFENIIEDKDNGLKQLSEKILNNKKFIFDI